MPWSLVPAETAPRSLLGVALGEWDPLMATRSELTMSLDILTAGCWAKAETGSNEKASIRLIERRNLCALDENKTGFIIPSLLNV
jgi:hypothetical protein